ncbi:c-type cytochrome [bacterium]|nr:c-type cytochrome [bacterium]
MNRKFCSVGILSLFLVACGRIPSEDVGRRVYATSCAPCHGAAGKGDGELAGFLYPRPRDFTRGVYKIRSVMDPAPTEEDLRRVVENGMAGSAMPAWKGRLSDREISAVLSHIKTLAPDAFSAPPSQPIHAGSPPAVTPTRLASGKSVYEKMQCAKCHGAGGVGDGPSAAALKDDLGFPIPPADFTLGIFKGGDDPRDIYTRFTTGMLGTPMPSFGELLTDEERWNLTLYVKSLSTESSLSDEPQTIVAALTSKITDNPYDPVWTKSPPVRVALRPLWQRSRFPRFAEVRAAHDGKTLAVHLVWFDPSKDASNVEVDRFVDAAAVQFPLSDEPGFFGMGAVLSPSNIWHWKADLQADIDLKLAERERRDVESAYPNMVADAYPFLGKDWSGARHDDRLRPVKDYDDPTFLTAWAAENPLSDPERKSPCTEYNAKGPGSLTAQPHGHQSIAGNGQWRGGVWTLVLLHELHSGDEMDAMFSMGDERPIAIAIWDGAAGDRDGQKVVSQWHRMALRP